MKERLDKFPTQLVLTIAWTVIGLPLSIMWGKVLLWTQIMSLYAIVVTHFSAHLAWRAKEAAEEAEGASHEAADAATSQPCRVPHVMIVDRRSSHRAAV